jgi:MFS family permease
VLVTFADAVPLALLAQAPLVVPLLLANFVDGTATEVFVVTWDVSLQEHIPPDRLARVYSYDLLGSLVALPAGAGAAGPLAARFGTHAILLGGAALVTVVTAMALLSRDVRTLRHQAPAVAAATGA